MRDPAAKTPDPQNVSASAARSDADRALAQRLLSDAKSGKDVRAAKVRRVRAAIKARTYENDLKLSVALDRLQNLMTEEAALLEGVHAAAKQGRRRNGP